MIEILHADSDTPVLRHNGLTLASLKDPVKEAKKWVEHYASPIGKNPHLIVLGLGCGYHVFELRKRYPDRMIYIVESCEEFLQFCATRFPLEMATLQTLIVDCADKIQLSAQFQQALSRPYCVLEHRASIQHHRSFYKELHALLLGRERAVFRESLNLRLRREKLFKPQVLLSELSDSHKDSELLSIKDLEAWLTPEARLLREGVLIQILRELVR